MAGKAAPLARADVMMPGLQQGRSKSCTRSPAGKPEHRQSGTPADTSGGHFATPMQQGDGWRGFQVFSIKSGNGNAARGIVLSNSCDVSAETARVLPPKVTFAPIVKLARIIGRIEAHGLYAENVMSRLTDIKA